MKTFPMQYAAFPALIIVLADDEGRRLVTPIPLAGAAMIVKLALWWLSIAALQRGPALRNCGAALAGYTLAAPVKLALSLVMGAYLGRALAWGLFGV
jgi:hypothetical protein